MRKTKNQVTIPGILFLFGSTVFFAAFAAAFSAEPVWNIRNIPQNKVTVVAHRGAGDLAPENTIEALQFTWKLGGIPEVDIRTSKDGVLVMFHDTNFRRIMPHASEELKKKRIEDLTWSEIQKLDIGSFRGKQFAGQKVVSLAGICQELKQDRWRQICIDVKSVDLKQLAREAKEVLPQIILTSGSYKNVHQWKKLAPNSQTLYWMGLGAGDAVLAPKIQELVEKHFVDVDRMQIHVVFDRKTFKTTPTEAFLKDAAAKAHAAGHVEFQLMPWGIPDREELYWRLFDLGAVGLGTDRPDVAFSALRHYYEQGQKSK